MARTLANKPGPQRPIAGLAIALGVNMENAVNMLANVLLTPPTPPLADDPPYRAWQGWTPTTMRTMTGGNGDFEMWELEHALRTLPHKKTAPGPDGVTTAAPGNIHPELRPALLEMLNKAWRNAVLPDSWRTARVVPVLKPGKPASEPTSYRPIHASASFWSGWRTEDSHITWRQWKHFQTASTVSDDTAARPTPSPTSPRPLRRVKRRVGRPGSCFWTSQGLSMLFDMTRFLPLYAGAESQDGHCDTLRHF